MTTINSVPASSQVNRVGKYLYKNIEGSFKSRMSPNTYELWFYLLYETPDAGPQYSKVVEGIGEVIINLNITTYRNNIRVNTIMVKPDDKVLGFDLFKPEDMVDLASARVSILSRVAKRIEKAFDGYEVMY